MYKKMDLLDVFIKYLKLRFPFAQNFPIKKWMTDIDNVLLHSRWSFATFIDENLIVLMFAVFRDMNIEDEIDQINIKLNEKLELIKNANSLVFLNEKRKISAQKRNMKSELFKVKFFAIFFTTLSIIGAEITYPQRLFLENIRKHTDTFWAESVAITNKHHSTIHKISSNFEFFQLNKQMLFDEVKLLKNKNKK